MISQVLDLSSAAAKVAGELAEKSKNGQLIDTGKMAGLAEQLGQLHARLMEMQVASTRVESDSDFRDFVRDYYRDDE